jgi:hypothetical protein
MWANYGSKNPHEARLVMQAYVDEARINAMEVNILRRQVSNCYYEHKVNHLEEWFVSLLALPLTNRAPLKSIHCTCIHGSVETIQTWKNETRGLTKKRVSFLFLNPPPSLPSHATYVFFTSIRLFLLCRHGCMLIQ